MIDFNLDDFKKIAKDIFETDSPTGFTTNVISVVEKYIKSFGYEYKILNNGALEVSIPGLDMNKTVATSAHCDTLGLMVRSISSNGTLKVTQLGGPSCPSLDGEYCKIYTRDGRVYTGTIISDSPAVHVFPDANTKPRTVDTLEVRIDCEVHSKEDVSNLGIQNGDIVCYDPKFEITETGFLKSRFIDDKASAVILLMLLKYTSEKKISFKYNTKIYFVVYEEVGHGASVIDPTISEFVTLDMGCIGLDLAGNEYSVSICAKDSHGPYDYELTTRLISMAKELELPHCVDIFPRYGSDIGAAWTAGYDIKGALIGTGVAASHSMERTHVKGVEATLKLIYEYLMR